MRYSKLFAGTLRAVPTEFQSTSYGLLLQAGYVRSLGQGLFSYLPLGLKVFRNLTNVIRKEMDNLGGQEVLVPMVNPLEIWNRSGRASLVSKDLIRFHDRTGKGMVLSPTHEEAMVELVRLGMRSYRQLPVFMYQFQSKFRDEEKTRSGLTRAKEFVMKDGYSFHRTFSDLNNFFPKVFASYMRIFEKCNIKVVPAEAGVGYMGGNKSYEFLMPSEIGENVLIKCDSCGYCANREIAIGIKDYASGSPLPMETVETPECTTMEKLSAYLDRSTSELAKSMVYKTPDGLVMAVVRGDYEVSIEKLSRLTKKSIVGFASRKDLKRAKLEPGYLSPLNVDTSIQVVVDDLVADSPNLVFGSGDTGTHKINVNFGRDYETPHVGDISHISDHNLCYHCGAPLKEERAIELGNIFKLDDFYSRSMGLSFQDDNDMLVYPYMGSYGIGLGRLMSAVVDQNHDEKGIVWPELLAPFKAYLMSIGNSLQVKRCVERLHDELSDFVLMDDRHESPGVKFRDAELLGIPYRVVITQAMLKEKKVEILERKTGRTWTLGLDRVADFIDDIVKEV